MSEQRRAADLSQTPLAVGVQVYIEADVPCVPVAGERTLLKGFTGGLGGLADLKTSGSGVERVGWANLAILLPEGLAGVDVDLCRCRADSVGSRAKLLTELELETFAAGSSSRSRGAA
jgi:hypothetical protein